MTLDNIIRPILTKEKIEEIWEKIKNSQDYSTDFPLASTKALTNGTVFGRVVKTANDFIKLTFPWARVNYSSLNKTVFEALIRELDIPEGERLDKMDAKKFTDFWNGKGTGRFWNQLNEKPGEIWAKGLTEKERLFITIDNYLIKNGFSSDYFIVGIGRNDFAYIDNEKNQGPFDSFGKIKMYYLSRSISNSRETGELKWKTWKVGKPTVGKSILVEKIFMEKSILESAIKSIKEGDQEKNSTEFDINKLIEKAKDQKYGFAGVDLYQIQPPDFFEDWADEEISLSTIDDALKDADIEFTRSRLVQSGTPGLSLADIRNELTNKDFGYTINQCILSSQLKELGEWRKDLRYNMYSSGSGPPYGARIYCVNVKNSNVMMNWMTQPQGMNDLVTKTSYKDFAGDMNSYGYEFKLFKIEEDDKGSSKKYEYKFETESGTTTLNDIRLKSRSFLQNPDDLSSKVFGTTQDGVGADKVLIENVEISIAGETIATVKSNIDVKIKFKLDAIEVINAVFEANSDYKDTDGKPIKYKFSLLEILTQQIGREYAGSQASRALKTAYVPTKNRLMMMINPVKKKSLGSKADRYFDAGPVMFDLSLLKYSMDKDAITQKVDLTVEFKGYIKSFLNSPMCDVLYDDRIKTELFEVEKKTVEDLESDSKYCDIRNLRRRLSLHFQDMKEVKKEAASNDFILKGLVKRGMMFKLTVKNLESALQGNIDQETRKLQRPQDLRETFSVDDIGQVNNENIPTPQVRATTAAEQKLMFFYFGDLIDVLLDRIYGEAKISGDDKYSIEDAQGQTIASWKQRLRETLRDGSTSTVIDQKFANFPLKVVMPTFRPLHFNQTTGTYVQHPKSKISIADIPISLSFFAKWFDEEIVKKKIKTYPLGGMINNLLNALVNNVLADTCYRSSSVDRKYYAVSTDFGVFDASSETKNKSSKLKNATQFDVINDLRSNLTIDNEQGYGLINVLASDAPVIRKRAKFERTDHCNFLIINELINSFATFENLDLGSNNKKKEEILSDNFIIPLKTNRIIEKRDKSGKSIGFKRSGFVRSISFTKTDLPYGEEIRFSKDGLNELHMLSAVHDATIETLPMFHMYPGQLCWIDAGFLEGTEIYGSIPWVVGMGGFHVVIGVKHSFDVAKGKILKKARTTIDAKFVSSGATEASTKKYADTCKQRADSYGTYGSTNESRQE